MSVTREDVHYIAKLARLQFSREEEEELAGDLSRILAYVEQLQELDAEGVSPMAHAVALHNVFRPDVVEDRVSRDEALESAPDSDGTYFRVPKVIE